MVSSPVSWGIFRSQMDVVTECGYRRVNRAPESYAEFELEVSLGNSLVVQWLRILLVMQGTWVWITTDGDCSHEIKRHLLLGRKVMTNLDSIFKSRDITLPTKVHLVKAMVFLVVMYGYESWTVKKAECRRIAAFELWCWRRLLRVPWTARRSNQSILKAINPGISLEGMMLSWNSSTLATSCEEWLIGKDSDAGRNWGQEEKGTTDDEMAGWHHWLNGRESQWTPGVGDGQGGLACCDSWGRKESDTTEWLIWSNLIWLAYTANSWVNKITQIHCC